MDRFDPIHQHLLIKAKIEAPMVIDYVAKSFLSELVNEIGMIPVTEPQAIYVLDLGNEGFTGSINLATSHIAFHCWDESGLLMVDVYSCKCFDVDIVFKHIDKYMGLLSASFTTLDRNNEGIYDKRYATYK